MSQNPEKRLSATEGDSLLESQVRPPQWEDPKPSDRYHLVVIGGGPAGLVAAAAAAGLGAKVALVERKFLGGDCLNTGCVPSKALISAARTVALVRRTREFGVRLPEDPVVDFAAVMERMRQLRARLSVHDSAHRFRELGVDVFFGQGRFLNGRQVEVNGAKLTFRRAVIATGSRAVAPAIPGLDSIDYLNHESLFSLTQLPRRLAVIGGGPIGCEMAQAFQQLGSQVTLLESAPGILTREDRDAAGVVQSAMERDGMRVRCDVRELAIATQQDAPAGGGGVLIRGVSQSQSWEGVADRVLVAAGRAANVDGLGLESAGVAYGSKGIQVNDRLQTTNPRIYAAGDVCSAFAFTHAADAMARIVIQNALFWGRKRASTLLIPWCTYTTPELAQVGLSQTLAESQGMCVDVYQEHFAACDRAVLDGEDAGFVRVLCRRGTDQILGVTIVGANAGDLIGEASLAMKYRLGLAKFSGAIHPYPTRADILRKLGDQYQRTKLKPWVKSLLRWRFGSR